MRLDQSSGQNVSGQHLEVHFHQGLGPGGAAPAGGGGFPTDAPPGGQAGGEPGAGPTVTVAIADGALGCWPR